MSIRKAKIKFFERQLLDFFRKAGRVELPWRRRRITAYEVWVSEIMLQQTQVSRVIGYYVRFLERFPTVETLAQTSWEEFLPYYAGLGYYARGRNMLKTARVIVMQYAGKFPRDRKLLEKLPGIGPYTAAAILSFASGDPHLAWDTNLKRVVGRFFFGAKQTPIDEAYFETRFLAPRKKLNAALMDFGSALCGARPKCSACPLRPQCAYFCQDGRGEHARVNLAPTKQNWKDAVAIVILHAAHRVYYSAQRTRYAPFVLPASHNDRAGIKDYFKQRYGLTLSVRPSHLRRRIAGKPQIVVYAQILLGQPTFRVYAARDAREALR